jgi:hypothetical protein
MGYTSKLCILLFLIFVLIYLLSSSNQFEYLTNLPSQQELSNTVNNFDNTKGYSSTESMASNKNDTTATLVAPPTPNPNAINAPPLDINYKTGTSGNTTSDPKTIYTNMTNMGPQNLDNASLNYYSNQMADSLNQKNFSANDFLPQEINTDWFNTDITKAQNEIDQSTLIDVARFCQGVDTIGQSLKNPSYDIRGNIPNPKITVSPFLNSSYDPDTNIKSWC